MKIIYNKIIFLLMTLCISCSLFAAAPNSQYTNGIDDEAIVVNVKSKISEDANLRGLDITVVSQDGFVILDGVVNNQAQIDAVVNTAKTINGVKNVTSALSLETPKN